MPRRFLDTAWPYAVVLLLGGLILLPKLGQFGLWDPWEPKYVESAQEMVERGSWFVPYFLGKVRLAKPILVYWGVLAGTAVVGVNELGARLAGVAFALASLAAVYYVVARLRGRQAGLLSALVLATVPQFYFLSRQVTPDVYLLTTFGCALLFFALGLAEPGPRRTLHFVLSYVCFSLAVLAKGPVLTGVLFLVALAVYAFVQIDLPRFWRPPLRRPTLRLLATVGLALPLLAALSVAAFWFGASYEWWSWSDRRRDHVAQMRDQLARTLERLQLPEIVLALLALAAVLAVVWILRRGRVAAAVLVGGAGLSAALAALLAALPVQILIMSVLGIVAILLLLAREIRRFALTPELWPEVRPWLGTVGRQTLWFAGVFAVVALPWHLVILSEQSHGFYTDFILFSNVKRASEEISHAGSVTFYMRTLVFGYFPWSCFIPAGMIYLVGWRERDALRRYAFEVWLLVACAVSFTALTGSITKFPHYLSVVAIPLAVLVGLTLDRLLDERRFPAARLGWLLAAMLYLLPVRDLLTQDAYKYLIESFTVKRAVPLAVKPGLYFTALVIGFAVLLLVAVLAQSRVLVGGLVVCAALLASYCTATFVPALSPYKSMKYLCDTWRRHAGAEGTLGFFGAEKYGMYFYAGKRLEMIEDAKRFFEFLHPEEKVFAIIERDELRSIDKAYRELHPGHRLWVLDASHLDYVLASNRPGDTPEPDLREPRLVGPGDD